ncbi:hypothetical protein BTO05_00765 [Winogradskyella sp. PC-19]|uniref:hypothetical protein n=1 Tax=Winogradskyella sp. PC-19 TaxID=754417 RepID=UPI000B3C240A|nr:hypothetical protein [Winogradskyella sp. PC-19]ARV08238.1 hypothetical protein BTO05_00765 [Winogradskyella sp. PC-19]
MKNYIKIIILALVLNSCGKAISNIAVEDRLEHSETLKLYKGDKIKFWTKIKYRYENALELGYSVIIYKNGEFYKQYNYNPLSTNPRYLSSDERWIISKKKNPDWKRYNENRFTIFGWKKNKDEREDHQKQKYIIKYGIKKNVKGKNNPVFTVKEDGEYTFAAKLNIDTENSFKIIKAKIILRK